MQTFAFLMHPLRKDDFARKFKFTQYLPTRLVEGIFRQVPPLKVSHVRGIRSATGAEAEGWLLALPLTPRQLLEYDWDFVLHRLLQSGALAERLGAKILGLGAFTKIAGDRGVSVARNLSIPVTTGNSYTAATAIAGLLHAAERMGHDPRQTRVTVLGATGAIGSACCQVLAEQVSSLVLVARNRERLDRLADDLRGHYGIEVMVDVDSRRAVGGADLVLAVSSATDVLVESQDLKPGAVVCDVARPRNISAQVHAQRDDVLVIDGGVIQVPGDPDFGFNFGFPPGAVEACMAETIMLALEGRYECFTLGPEIRVDQVREIYALGQKHGFTVSGLRRFERAISDEEVARIRERATGQLAGRRIVRLAEAQKPGES